MRILVFDTETTGLLKPSAVPLEKQPKIIELGCAIWEGGKIVDEGNWLIDPGEQIEAVITKITGITNDQLTGQQSFNEVWGKACDMFHTSDAVIAHNLPFDKTMIDNELGRAGGWDSPWPPIQVCSVQEYVHLFGHRPKLTDLYERFVGKPLAQTHRALDDVKALIECLEASGLLAELSKD